MNSPTKDFKDKPELPVRKMTREEIRRQQRVSAEVNQVYRQITSKFFDVFINSDDPEGPEVQERIKTIDSQWRVFCKRKNLKAEGYPVIREYCNTLIEQYRREKEGEPVAKETIEKAPQE